MKKRVFTVLVAWTACCSPLYVQNLLAQSEGSNPNSQDWSTAGPILAERARKALSPTEATNEFTIEYVDSSPSIELKNGRGYRIVLSKIVEKDLTDPKPSPTRRPPSILVKEYIEIVVFPIGESLAASARDTIPWSGFTSFYHVQPVDMGTGFGFRWFGRMHLWEQDDIRERLGLKDGDNRQGLATQASKVKDPGNMTANSMASRMHRFKGT